MELPDTNLLPAPLWLLTALHLLTLSLHFVAMNFVLGGTLAVLFGGFGADRWSNPTVQRLVRLLPTGMAATITLGVAPLLFLQLVYPKQVYAAAIISGWYWLAIVLLAAIAYSGLYAASFTGRGGGAKAALLAVAALCLLGVSLIYTSVFSLAEMPELQRRLYAADPSGLVFNPAIGTWIWRWLHMVLASVTVGGFFVGLLAGDDDVGFQVSKRLVIGGMAAAALTGLLHTFRLGEALIGLMRGPGITWLIIGVAAAMAALHFHARRRFVPAGLLLLGSVVAMVVTRHTVRLVRLGEALVIPPVRSQWVVFGLFLGCFVLALGLLTWMLRLFFRQPQRT